MGEQSCEYKGNLVTQGVFLSTELRVFEGTLNYLRVISIGPCESGVCGDADCRTLDALGGYQCLCPTGTDGMASATGEGCVPSKRTCTDCQELGWKYEFGSLAVCGAVVDGACPDVTHAEAEAKCEAKGARLCTMAEVTRGEAKSTGCGIDDLPQWTSTPCTTPEGKPGFIQQGDANMKKYPPTCVPATDRYKFRCCADQPFNHLSGKSCAQLGWPVRESKDVDGGSTTVCAESQLKLTADLRFDGKAKTCLREVEFATAEVACAAVGARLCTVRELKSKETLDTGCGLNLYSAWSSNKCVAADGTPGMFVVQGDGEGDATCLKTTQFIGVGTRCCADTVVPEPQASEKTCKQLGWVLNKGGDVR